MNVQHKTLVILTPGFPANEADSNCLPFPQLFVKKLAQLQPALNIVVMAFQYPFFASTYSWNGVTVIALNGRNKGKLNRLLVWKAVLKNIHAINKKNKLTGILNFWLGECGLVGKYAGKKYGIPCYTWLLGQDARRPNRYYRYIKPTSQSLVALSDAVADEFYRNYQIMPANIIPPGVETTDTETRAAVRDIDILGVGSLIPLKRFDIFITVVKSLADTWPRIHAVICGQGPERLKLRQMIINAGLENNITLAGELRHDVVMTLMRRSKILLHPSSYEGFATVYTEALYAGAQVVGFCQPMKEIFPHQHVVETIPGMIDTVQALLADEQLQHRPVITWPIETTCSKVLALFQMQA